MSAIVAVDTATERTVVGAWREGDLVHEEASGPGPDGRPRHSGSLLELAERAAAALGGWGSVELLAAGVGPGTFTGLRIGISTVRGLAQALSLPVAGVSSLDALALGAGAAGPVAAAIDARRGQVFWAVYDPAEGLPKRRAEVEALDPGEIAARLVHGGGGLLAVGDGAVRFRQELESAGAAVPPDGDPVHRIQARSLCRLGEEAEPVDPELIRPHYVRPPDAELWRERDRR